MELNRRLDALEETLDSLYETLEEAQKRLGYANDIFERNSIKQRIRREVLPDLHQYETEYWQLLAQIDYSTDVNEVQAQNAIIQVQSEVVKIIQIQSQDNSSNELLQKLQEILDKLNEPDNPAAAKAKLALNLIPGILVYEIELDTENTIRKAFQIREAFQPIKQLFKRAFQKK